MTGRIVIRHYASSMLLLTLLATSAEAKNDCRFNASMDCASTGSPGKCAMQDGTCKSREIISGSGRKVKICACECSDPLIVATFSPLSPGPIAPPTTASFEPVGTWTVTGTDPMQPTTPYPTNPTGSMQINFSPAGGGFVEAKIHSLMLSVTGLPNGSDETSLFSPVDQFIIVDDTTIVTTPSHLIIDEATGESIGAISMLTAAPHGDFTFAGLISGTTDLSTGDIAWSIEGVQCAFETDEAPTASILGWVLLVSLLAGLAVARLVVVRRGRQSVA